MSSLLVFKRERTRSQMEKNSLDLLVASLPENIYYLCGFDKNLENWSKFGLESATRLHEVGFASNRASAMAR